jgi:hypothetical protein
MPGCTDGAETERAVGKVVSEEQHVAASDYGRAWPFTVESGTLRCWRPDPQVAGSDYAARWAITFTPDNHGETYKLAGTYWDTSGFGWTRIDAIHRTDPASPRQKMNLGPVIDDGQRLCPSPPISTINQ